MATADPGHRLERLVFFSDAVFAIAITLLVLDIHAPDLPRTASDAAWRHALVSLVPNAMAFLLSFLVVAVLWITHHRLFSFVAHFQRRLLWPNLLLLLAVAFLPFASALLSRSTASTVPSAIYCCVLLFAAMMKTWLTITALKPDLLAHHVSSRTILVERRRSWLMPAACLLALVATLFASSANNMWALLVMPVALRLPWFRLSD